MKTEIELKPCPFCGSEAVEYYVCLNGRFIASIEAKCTECHSQTRNHSFHQTVIKRKGAGEETRRERLFPAHEFWNNAWASDRTGIWESDYHPARFEKE